MGGAGVDRWDAGGDGGRGGRRWAWAVKTARPRERRSAQTALERECVIGALASGWLGAPGLPRHATS